jgi:hypothetical protein
MAGPASPSTPSGGVAPAAPPGRNRTYTYDIGPDNAGPVVFGREPFW